MKDKDKQPVTAKDIISYSIVSKLMTNNPTYIRRDKVPLKYADSLKELETVINKWIKNL
jgi:hypothetical protein